MQASTLDGLLFDPFSGFQDCGGAAEGDVCGRSVRQAFVIAAVVVMVDEGSNLHLKVARQVVILKEDPVF
jgi:hypothetical protein